ncbi:CLUMA_CG004441, isoform A [Clunio marinus]|uniref:CLUMA_CG004441, isoform A n=1 Tax=Clunio marinus TaxID=568069 RepID=A0A1J1HRV1_9DIPT|nr:CLUMA_CG004441, isoform A [Clunio marinus]
MLNTAPLSQQINPVNRQLSSFLSFLSVRWLLRMTTTMFIQRNVLEMFSSGNYLALVYLYILN